GPDVETAVHLHRIERHDLAVAERAGDRQRNGRLAGGGRTDEREMPAHTSDAVTGIRTRRERVGRTRRTESPRSQCGAAVVMRASTYSPGANGRSLGGARCTSLLCRVRPDHIAASFFEGPSMSTSSVAPTRAS